MKVLELAPRPACSFATMLLAQLGAEVVTVATPNAEQGRPPVPPSGYSTTHAFLQRGKQPVALDVRTRPGRARFLDLVRDADAVVESCGPEGLRDLRLRYGTLKRANPSIVLTSISSFGLDGPRADWETTEIVLEALGGIVHATGWDGTPPFRLPGMQAEYIAGLNAAIATLTAVYGVQSGTARGVHIDLSVQEALVPHWTRHVSRYVYGGLNSARASRVEGPQGFRQTERAADGWVFVDAPGAAWEALAQFLGLEEFTTHEWSDPEVRAERWGEIEPHLKAAVARRGKYDWFAAAAEHDYTFAPVDDPHELLQNPQFAARGFLQPVTLDDGQTVAAPGLPFTVRDGAAAKRDDGMGTERESV